MHSMFDRTSLTIMGSALLVAVLALLPAVNENFLGHLLFRGLYFGEILFHEMGHAIAAWLMGIPAIPSILTVIGDGDHAGFTMWFGHLWLVQLLAIAAMGYGCYWTRIHNPMYVYPACLIAVVITIIGFTPYKTLFALYMGHGGSIVMAGVLLYRAWLFLEVTGLFGRWCCAVWGWFILLNNVIHAYKIMHDAETQQRLQTVFNDYTMMIDEMPRWTESGIAMVTIALCIVTCVTACLLAWIFREDEQIDLSY